MARCCLVCTSCLPKILLNQKPAQCAPPFHQSPVRGETTLEDAIKFSYQPGGVVIYFYPLNMQITFNWHTHNLQRHGENKVCERESGCRKSDIRGCDNLRKMTAREVERRAGRSRIRMLTSLRKETQMQE